MREIIDELLVIFENNPEISLIAFGVSLILFIVNLSMFFWLFRKGGRKK